MTAYGGDIILGVVSLSGWIGYNCRRNTGGGEDSLKSFFGRSLGLTLVPRMILTFFCRGAIYGRCVTLTGLGELRAGTAYMVGYYSTEEA